MGKNDGEDIPSHVTPAMVYSIGNLLDQASKQLSLPRAARRLFMKATGEEIYYLDQLRNNMELVVSMGEELRMARARSPSPRRRPSSPPKQLSRPAKMVSGRDPWIAAGPLYSNSRVNMAARQAQNPRADNSMRCWPAGVKRPRVIVHHNDGGHSPDCYPLLVYSMRSLLDEGTASLGLARCARRVFDTSGREITQLESLENMMEIVLSEGEAFRPRHRSPNASDFRASRGNNAGSRQKGRW